MMSDADDKEDPNYFRRGEAYRRLPSHVRRAIANGQTRAKHSDFYYRLQELGQKVQHYKQFFKARLPQHQVGYMLKQMEQSQVQHKRDREALLEQVKQLQAQAK